MSSIITCQCGQQLNISEEMRGRNIKCPACQSIIQIVAAEQLVTPSGSTHSPVRATNDDNLYAAGPALTGAPYAATNSSVGKRSSVWLLLLILGIGGMLAGGMLVALLMYVYVGSRVVPPQQAIETEIGPLGPQTPSTDARRPLANSMQDVDEEDCIAAAELFTTAIQQGDLAGSLGFIDYAELVRRATANVAAPEKSKQSFIAGFLNQAPTGSLEQQILKAAGDDSTYDVLRAHRVGNETRVWLRLGSTTEGLIYQDVVFYRNSNGEAKAADMYNMTSGELMSQTIKRLYIMALAGNNLSALALITGEQSEFIKHIDAFKKLSQTASSQPDEALRIYRDLPKSLQQNKVVMLMRIQAAGNANESDYMEAMQDFRNAYPDDPAVDIQSIDWHFLRGEFDDALAAIEAVDEVVGGDPFLDTYRANILAGKGDIEQASAYLDKALEVYPHHTDSHWTRISLTLQQSDFAATLKYLKLMDESFEMQWGDLREIEEYAGFVASPYFQEWQTYIKK